MRIRGPATRASAPLAAAAAASLLAIGCEARTPRPMPAQVLRNASGAVLVTHLDAGSGPVAAADAEAAVRSGNALAVGSGNADAARELAEGFRQRGANREPLLAEGRLALLGLAKVSKTEAPKWMQRSAGGSSYTVDGSDSLGVLLALRKVEAAVQLHEALRAGPQQVSVRRWIEELSGWMQPSERVRVLVFSVPDGATLYVGGRRTAFTTVAEVFMTKAELAAANLRLLDHQPCSVIDALEPGLRQVDRREALVARCYFHTQAAAPNAS